MVLICSIYYAVSVRGMDKFHVGLMETGLRDASPGDFFLIDARHDLAVGIYTGF